MTDFSVHLYDQFGPEDTAMMQALYSRSSSSVTSHADKVQQTGSGKFMERFYVGYGHKSIADCGSTTMFIENVSMLAAKAIQDWPLYSGQETSSRYIDMSQQDLVDPLNSVVSKAILQRWVDFYVEYQEEVKAHLRLLYPKSPEEKKSVYERAVAAWAFDVLRGFLPAGITTQLSWHTNLRQAWDKLFWLLQHPSQEVKNIAETMLSSLQKKYAHSFGFQTREPQADYAKAMVEQYAYFEVEKTPEKDVTFTTNIDPIELAQYADLFATRPKYTPVPQFIRELGHVSFTIKMDFGSFRDIQRHRNGVCRMPLLTTKHGFNPWYLDQLPTNVREKAEQLLREQEQAIEALPVNSEVDRQYYIAMGYNVVTRVTYPLNAAVYTTELRSGVTVHPTLRKVAHQMHHYMTDAFPELVLHSDLNPADRDVRRGLQDIQEKQSVTA